MDMCTGCRDVTEILLKKAFNTKQSINTIHTHLKMFILFYKLEGDLCHWNLIIFSLEAYKFLCLHMIYISFNH